MFDPASFARRLDLALRERRMAASPALAATLGVDERAIDLWRRGEALSLDDLMRLSGHLRVSIDWLLTGSGLMDVQAREADLSTIAADLAVLDPGVRERLADLTRHLVDGRRPGSLDPDAADEAGAGRGGPPSVQRRTDG